MSHTATVQIEFNDKSILKQVCERLGLEFIEGPQTVRLYQGPIHDCDFSVKLPGWRYPLAIKGKEIHFDNYEGRWGKEEELTKLQDGYSRDITIQQAENMGMTWNEQFNEETGEITLILTDYS